MRLIPSGGRGRAAFRARTRAAIRCRAAGTRHRHKGMTCDKIGPAVAIRKVSTMAVPLLDLKLQYQQIRDEVMTVTEEIYESQMFILGKRVEEFEKDFDSYCHTRYSVGVSSGTDALLIALMVLDLEPGDEVIVPAYSFFATAGVVERLELIPVFVDIEPDSFNIDPAQIESHMSSRTKVIIP